MLVVDQCHFYSADVVDEPSRVADDDRVRRHRTRHHRAGAHHRVRADRHTREDGRVGPDRCTPRDCGLRDLVLPVPATWEVVVRERRIWSDEDVVFDAQSVPQLNPGLDRDPVADRDIAFDEHSITEVAVSPDHCAGKHVDERPDPRSWPNLIRLAQALRMEHDVVSGRHRTRARSGAGFPAAASAYSCSGVPTVGG